MSWCRSHLTLLSLPWEGREDGRKRRFAPPDLNPFPLREGAGVRWIEAVGQEYLCVHPDT